MFIKNKSINKFVDMDNIFLTDFTYQNIEQYLLKLQSKYSNEDILNYLITRSTVETPDLTIIKYIYPIFLMPTNVLYENIDLLVSNLNDNTIEFMFEHFDKNKVKDLMRKYLENKLYKINIESFEDFGKLINKINYPSSYKSNKSLSLLYQELLKEDSIQDPLCSLIRFISHNLSDLIHDHDDVVYFVFEHISTERIYDIEKEILNLITGTYNKRIHTDILRKIVKRKIYNTSILAKTIEFMNENKNKVAVGFIFEKLKDILFSNAEVNKTINIKVFIDIAKSFDINEWKWILNKFTELNFNIDKEIFNYISRITTCIEKSYNLKLLSGYQSLDYYMEIIISDHIRYDSIIKRLISYITGLRNINPVKNKYYYSSWQTTLKYEDNWHSLIKNDYYKKGIISIRIAKYLLTLINKNMQLQDFVKFILLNPYNHILMNEVYIHIKNSNVELEKIAKNNINDIMNNEDENIHEADRYGVLEERLSLLIKFLTIQNNEILLNKVLLIRNGFYSKSVTTAIANSLLKL